MGKLGDKAEFQAYVGVSCEVFADFIEECTMFFLPPSAFLSPTRRGCRFVLLTRRHSESVSHPPSRL